MTPVPSEQPPSTPAFRRAIRWGAVALLLIAMVTLLITLSPGGPGTAGPQDPSAPVTDEPSSPEPDPSTQPAGPTDDPSAPPSDAPPASPSDGPSTPPADAPTDDPTDPGATPAAPAPPGAPAPAAPGALDEEAATTVVATAVVAPLSGADSEAELAAVLADVAVDGYAAELEAQWIELSTQGWSKSGSARVDSLEILSLSADSDPATAEVAACIDSAEVTIVDAEGAPIGDPAATAPRARHHFTMVQGDDGIWRISLHTFPDDPSC